MKRAYAWTLACLLVASACGGGGQKAREASTSALRPPKPMAARKYMEASRLLGKRANDRRATGLLEEAIRIDPQLWEAHYNLGVVLRRRGRIKDSIAHYRAAHELSPPAAEPVMGLAESLVKLGERDEAADLLEAHLEEQPDDNGVRIALTAVLREQGEFDDALAQARQALIREPSAAPALLEVGRIYRAMEELDVAELVLKKAAGLDDTSPAPHNELGLLALARGDTQLAFGHFAAALERDPAYAPARLNRASVLLRAGDYPSAAEAYQKLLDKEPDRAEALVGLGITQRARGQHKRAADTYQKVLDEDPENPAALFNLAVLELEFRQRPSEAQPLFERFLEVGTSEPHRKMAEAYLEDLRARSAQAAAEAAK